MTEPSVTVCVGFRPRNEHDQQCWDWCERRWHALLPDWRLIVADTSHDPYNRSAARNLAAVGCGEHGDPDVFVFANSDTTFLHADDMRAAVASAADGVWVLPALYVETNRGYTSVVLHEDPAAALPDPLSGYDRQLSASCAGPQVVRADQFRDVGGWDEGFTGWGWEDAAFRDALDTLHGPHTKIGTSVHLWHARGVPESPATNGKNRARWATIYKRASRRGPSAMRTAIETASSRA
jgi:hypothetical protein